MATPMRRIFRENGLSLAMFGLFLLCEIGQILTGLASYNDERRDHGRPEVAMVQYLGSGHFIEALFENWESEFLQMAAFVVLSVSLRQKGSPESKDLEGEEEVDEDPRKKRDKKDAPWPVRRGGWVLKLYEHSLSLGLLLLFLLSFILHGVGGMKAYNEEQRDHGQQPVSLAQFLESPQFWFQSFQNWQSEFLSIGVLVVFGIFLREKGSAESKAVADPHSQTGGSP
jgi:hypothetical protein